MQISSRWKTIASVTLLLAAAGCAPRGDVAGDRLCEVVIAALPKSYKGGRDCVAVPAGVVVGRKKEISGLAPLLTEAKTAYVRYFRREPRRIAFVVGTDIPEAVARAVESESALAFNWPTMKGQRNAFLRSMRAEVDETFAHAPKEAREEILAKIVASFDSNISDDGKPSPFEAGTIRHEFGHRWFVADFDGATAPKPPPTSGIRYGSAAPDWLDEASAILMENAYLTDLRRKQLTEMLGTEDRDAIPTLAHLTSLTHPTQSNTDGGGVMEGNISIRTQIRRRGEARVVEKDSGWFYAMTRGSIDFFIEKTGDDRIVYEIAEEMRRGGDLGSWLAASPRRQVLGGNLAGLEQAWRHWLLGRLTVQPSASGGMGPS